MILLSSCVIFKKTLCSIFLWLAGGRELNNFFSSTAFNLRAVTNQHWLHQCNPFWSFGVWRQWISIPSEISAGAWGIQPGLSCLASCSHKPLAGAPVEAALLQHPRGEVWLHGHRVCRFAASHSPRLPPETSFTGRDNELLPSGEEKQWGTGFVGSMSQNQVCWGGSELFSNPQVFQTLRCGSTLSWSWRFLTGAVGQGNETIPHLSTCWS